MISSDRLDFLNPRFLVERERFSQSLQLSVNQTINSPGTSKAPSSGVGLFLFSSIPITYIFIYGVLHEKYVARS